MDKEFACFSAMNESTRAQDVVMSDKVAIHPVDGFSFFVLTDSSLQKCRIPAKAPLMPEGKEGAGPWLVKVVSEKVHYNFSYPNVSEQLFTKGAPAAGKPECSAAADAKSVAKVLENRISDSRQACSEGPKMANCLGDFVARLKSCEDIAAIKDYVMEIGRSAAIHAAPRPSAEAEIGR